MVDRRVAERAVGRSRPEPRESRLGRGVEPDAGTGVTAYDVTKKATAPFTAISALRVGGGFKALVAGPELPSSMEISWDQPVPARGEQAEAVRPSDVHSRLAELDRLHRSESITDEEYQAQRVRTLGSI